MKIIEIKKLKRLYKLTLDDFISADSALEPTDRLYVTEDTLVKFMLSKGNSYTETELLEISAYANYSRGKSLAIYYLGFKSRTAHEVAAYLDAHEIPGADIPRILSELTTIGLIDDNAYATRAVESAVLSATKGPYAIKQKLLLRGIPESIILSALTENFPEELQLELATKSAQKKLESLSARTPAKLLKQKLQQNLVSKGFSFSVAADALDQLTIEKDDDTEQELLTRELDKQYNRLGRRYDGYDLKQRVTQALARKGFSFSDISDALSDYEF
ncbi:MAG: recombination regulator RecX [Streptococcaceae bacterium]|jgi:regulatory protein|nr:recombination regulator RecX [Streptococcaceae bacterium]